MLTEQHSSTGISCSAARLLLGHDMRNLREHRAVEPTVAADYMGIARATLWRMEQGDPRCRYKPGDIERFARMVDADHDTRDRLLELALATRAPSWAHAYHDVLSTARVTYLDLEAYAVRVRRYADLIVPGLLACEDYTTAEMTISAASSEAISAASPLLPHRHQQVRRNRQHVVLGRDPQPATLEFILDESALVRATGPAGTMSAQISHTIDCAGMAGVTVRVVPHRAGLYPALRTGPFTLLDFPDHTLGQLTPRIHRPGHDEQRLLDDPDQVELFNHHWDNLTATALDQTASTQLLNEIAERHDTRPGSK